MKRCFAVAASLAAAAAAGRDEVAGPLEKVVNLLKDLKAQIDGDAKVEEKMYNKYACWCEEASQKKATAIEASQGQLKEAGQTILQLKGEIATLDAEMKRLDKQMEENQAAQDEATELRRRSNEEYLALTAETKQAMVALEKAVAVLIKGATATGEGEALLQQGAGRALVQTVVESLPRAATVPEGQMALLSEFLDGRASYTPQSMTVQGILKDMYTTFAGDVEKATLQEADENRKFEDFIATSITQLNEDQALKMEKEDLKASKEASLAEESQLYDDTYAQMKADEGFFDTAVSSCEAKHQQWTLRKNARTQELAGIIKAIDMLSTDSARELFAAAIKPGKETSVAPSFLQSSQGEPALQAYDALKSRAAGAKSLRLASLAVRVRESKAGHFDAVLEEIDRMIQVLKEEETADIAKRDQCKEEITKSNSTILQLEWEIKCNNAKIDKLTRKMEEIDTEKQQTLDEIKSLNAFMKEIEDQRRSEHDDFLSAKEKDLKAIALLVKVRNTFSHYYQNHSIAMGPIQGGVKDLGFVQRQPSFERSEFDAPDVKFSHKGSHKNEAKGIIGILTMVAEDLGDEISNAMKQEEEAQLAFEDQMKASKTLKKKAGAKVTMLEGMHAGAGEEKAAEITTKEENHALLKNERGYLDGITPDCDWVFKSFLERDAKRAAEMQGLTQAKQFLSGAKASAPAELAQLSRFDDAALGSVRFLGVRA
jgi:hypothetical protein